MFLQFTDVNTSEVFRCTCTEVELPYIKKVNKKLAKWCSGRIVKREQSESSFPGLTLSEFKHELRMEDVKGDPWGVSLCAFFDLCAVAYERMDVPEEWGYSVGWGGNNLDDESWFQKLFSECTDEQLLTIGNYLFRLTSFLETAGKSY